MSEKECCGGSQESCKDETKDCQVEVETTQESSLEAATEAATEAEKTECTSNKEDCDKGDDCCKKKE